MLLVTPPPGFWQREASHYPQPMSPMSSSILMPALNASLRLAFSEAKLLIDRLEFAEIGGWVYQRLVPLGEKERKAPPAWAFRLFTMLVPRVRARIRECVEAVRSDHFAGYIDRWFDEWKPDLVARMDRLRGVDLTALSPAELEKHARSAVSLLEEGWDIHFLLHGNGALLLADLAFTCRDLFGWDDAKTFDLLNGLSTASTGPARRLADLAAIARERPALRRALETADESTSGRLAEIDTQFAAEFAAYQAEFDCRALRYEIADQSLVEVPSVTLGLISDQLARGYDPGADRAALDERRAATVDEARLLLDTRNEGRDRFERALQRAERAYPIREDNEFYTVSAPIALVRYALLEVGRRLATSGAVALRDDIFFLRFEEAMEALASGSMRATLVDERKRDRQETLANPGPATYGKDPGPPPPFHVLPPEARFAHAAALWLVEKILAPQESARAQKRGDRLEGVAAAPGAYTGPVRVIMSEDEFDKLEPGDVLVCPITSPVWSVLFPSVGALVTDTGGILSHPAIIAREYQVPAVVGVGNATALLSDGQLVTVDGSAGLVELAR